MLVPIHADIVRRALQPHFSPEALEAILQANLGQDTLRGQFGHDEYHFDNNAFEAGRAYIEEQRRQIFAALKGNDVRGARSAFGRLTHTAQDFYAHSNYVDLWRAGHPDAAPAAIDPLDAGLMSSPELHSGRVYFPLDFLYFVPGFRNLALSILPKDSHAHMNLDSAARGLRFEYAFAAAVQRTEWEFGQVKAQLKPQTLLAWTDR